MKRTDLHKTGLPIVDWRGTEEDLPFVTDEDEDVVTVSGDSTGG
jgi:hypothetical protein